MKRFLFLILSLLPVLSAAETRYVSDELTIYMRSGPSTQFSITKGIKSGAALNVIERSPDGWSKIRTNNGKTGWVLTRQLQNTPVARDQVQSLQEKVERLQAEKTELADALGATSGERDASQQAQSSLRDENTNLATQLKEIRSTASRALQLESDNTALQSDVKNLQSQLSEIKLENQALKGNIKRDWFLVGAGVLFGGIILGLILPRIRWGRKTSWDSL